MTEEEAAILTWFLDLSGVIQPRIPGGYTFEDWYRDVRCCGLSGERYDQLWKEYHEGTTDAGEQTALLMGERAYKQMLGIAQQWGRRFYRPGSEDRARLT